MTTGTVKPCSVTLDDERPRPDSPDRATYLHHLARYEFALTWIQPQHRILEAGCGTGYGSQLVAGHAAYVFGTDYSPIALSYAKANYPAANLDYAVMDCEQLAVGREGFDGIICFEVIEHLNDQPSFLEACRRALRPGGFLIVSTPNRTTAEIHMSSIRMQNHFHVGMLDLRSFRRTLAASFSTVEVYGQRRHGNRLYSALRSLDVFNLRLRMVSPHRRMALQEHMGVAASAGLRSQDWIFSKSQLRQANNFVAICWK